MTKTKRNKKELTYESVNTDTGEILQQKSGRPRVRTPYNAHLLPAPGEIFEEPSNTIPEQSLSIKQLLHRYSRGLPLDAPIQNAVYDGEEMEFPDLARLDLAERQELLESARAETKRIETILRDNAQARQKKHAEKARELERKKWLDEFNQTQNKGQGSTGKQNPQNPPSEP